MLKTNVILTVNLTLFTEVTFELNFINLHIKVVSFEMVSNIFYDIDVFAVKSQAKDK